MEWNEIPQMLGELTEEQAWPVLHYLYSGALPSGLKTSVAKEIIVATESVPALDDFRALCRTYVSSCRLAKSEYYFNRFKPVNEVLQLDSGTNLDQK